MNPKSDHNRAIPIEASLEAAYEQWERLALAEGEAIRARDWTRLTACQQALQHLPAQITEHLQEARREWAALGLDCVSRECAFKTRVEKLIALEQQNEAWLQEARRALQAQLGQSQQTTRTLHRLRSSYAPAPQAAWTSYS